MATEITITVGDLYAQMHQQYSEGVDEYDEQTRQQVENFIHNFNQQVERQIEAQQSDTEITIGDEDDVEIDTSEAAPGNHD